RPCCLLGQQHPRAEPPAVDPGRPQTVRLGRVQCGRDQSDNTAVCWGSNTYGQSTLPAGLGTINSISAGHVQTCAIKSTGAAVCWGYAGSATAPRGLTAVSSISVGGLHTCAIRGDGSTVCWGDNAYGQSTPPA